MLLLGLLLSAVLVALLTLAELRAGDRLSRGRLSNCALWSARMFIAWTLLPLVALALPFSLIDGATMPFIAAAALYFVAMDAGEYLFHRAQHSIPWLWKLHSLHHSDPDMNATTTERHFVGDQLIKSLTAWPLAALIVRPTVVMVVAYIVASQWNFVSHAKLPWSFGRFSWLLNSPAYHRRHHSALPEHYNSNFAAVLPIWDVLLGSYRRPAGAMPPTGLGGMPPTVRAMLAWPLALNPARPVGRRAPVPAASSPTSSGSPR